ncbi:hypothetical protein BGY98DRAFT_930322 [Russula aff. rugulosa BPL654]|nr:hypothetical protein BGY98DRAFT_930322 [Russula aff. rugulosa BPL654]
MASASQIHATMQEDQLAELLSNVKSLRETEELRARLPAQLAPFTSNISIIEPIQTISASPHDGVNGCSFSIKERRIYMSVAVVPSSDSQLQDSEEEPHAKPLKLIWRDWRTRSLYISGSADSHMHSIFLQYGPTRGINSKGKAFTGWYDDPQISASGFSHGDIKSIVEKVVRDMGLRESELENKLEVIEALLGDDGKELLESHVKGKTLRKIIEDELDQRRLHY